MRHRSHCRIARELRALSGGPKRVDGATLGRMMTTLVPRWRAEKSRATMGHDHDVACTFVPASLPVRYSVEMFF